MTRNFTHFDTLTRKSWVNAEEDCSSIGGHLPSVHSIEDLTAIAEATGYYDGVWLGGYLTPSGHWAWSDGTPWDYTNWDTEDPQVQYGTRGGQNNCTVMWADMTWWDWPCPEDAYTNRFACQKDLPKIHAINSTNQVPHMILNFSNEFQSLKALDIWMQHDNNEKIVTNNKQQPPFHIKWYVNNEQKKSLLKSHEWMATKGKPKHKQIYLIRIVNLVYEARARNVSSDLLITKVLQYKKVKVSIDDRVLNSWCENDELKDECKIDIFEGLFLFLNMRGSSELIR